jgi:thioesterase domain-containing protein/aryl carrier-like protein
VHVLDELPLTPNGKVDRAALPDVTAPAGGTAPRSRTEAAVAAIVADVLGVPAVGVHDDFFALGGHSLLLVRLAAELRRSLGAALPVAALFTAPTVAGVARLLSSNVPAGEAALAPILPLHPEGSAAPVFCLPPASGLTWQFAALKRYLDVPLIGLQSPSLSGLPVPDSMAALAASHADRVVALAPTGPIRLLGWSFGGALALCLAAELTARGREVTFVGMLDTRRAVPLPAPGPSDGAENPDPCGAVPLPAPGPSDGAENPGPSGAVASLLTELGFEIPPGTLTVTDAVALIRASDDPVAALTDPQIALVVENYLTSDRLMATATYPAYAGKVFFVDAARDGTASAAWTDLPRLETHALPVAHSEILDPATLEKLGPLLAEALRD